MAAATLRCWWRATVRRAFSYGSGDGERAAGYVVAAYLGKAITYRASFGTPAYVRNVLPSSKLRLARRQGHYLLPVARAVWNYRPNILSRLIAVDAQLRFVGLFIEAREKPIWHAGPAMASRHCMSNRARYAVRQMGAYARLAKMLVRALATSMTAVAWRGKLTPWSRGDADLETAADAYDRPKEIPRPPLPEAELPRGPPHLPAFTCQYSCRRIWRGSS